MNIDDPTLTTSRDVALDKVQDRTTLHTGACIAYFSKQRLIINLSSTEAKCVAACDAEKNPCTSVRCCKN